jgi:hypothetical protein
MKWCGGTGHCAIKKAAAKREPDRASFKEKRRTEMRWPVGPTLHKNDAGLLKFVSHFRVQLEMLPHRPNS